jgi:acyl dehydratase
MRLITASELKHVANGLIGMGIKDMRWPQPTRAGDTLRAKVEVLAQKPSASQPGFGVVQLRWTSLETSMTTLPCSWRPPSGLPVARHHNRTSMKKACPD